MKTKKINFVAIENEKANYLFVAWFDRHHETSNLWFVESGYLNHMASVTSLFEELDEKLNKMAQLDNIKQMQVEKKRHCVCPH